MAKVIAVAGKGGVGKTTIAALIVRYLKEKNYIPILAVDADPSMNLNLTLGVEVKETVANIREQARPGQSRRSFHLSLADYFDLEINMALVEAEAFDLLAMGALEGKGCYCAANRDLRLALKKLASSYKYVVIDNEAGIEHISRQTDGKVDVMIIVSDPTPKGIITAIRTNELIKRLENEVKYSCLIINRVLDTEKIEEKIPTQLIEEFNKEFALVGMLRTDPCILEYELLGRSIFELPAESIIYQDLKTALVRINQTCQIFID